MTVPSRRLNGGLLLTKDFLSGAQDKILVLVAEKRPADLMVIREVSTDSKYGTDQLVCSWDHYDFLLISLSSHQR